MMIRLEIRAYCRPFKTPLLTVHGPWKQREGLILKLTDGDGRITYSEVAPLPWFGTETCSQAKTYLAQWPQDFVVEQITAIPDQQPACQFGLGNGARLMLGKPDDGGMGHRSHPPVSDICALLPSGAKALEAWPALWQRGHHTFKWKIGLAQPEEEIMLFRYLVATLPAMAKIRLDANGGLSAKAAAVWLRACDEVGKKVEFLEQPLPPAQILDWLSRVVGQFATPIALDESVVTVRQLQAIYQQVGNRVVYVIKPAIAGFPHRVLDFCRTHPVDVVFSSALETVVGRQAAFDLAHQVWAAGRGKRALGFGVGHWFADDWEQLSEEALWERL
jgi:O-succinylbenzoate synthase